MTRSWGHQIRKATAEETASWDRQRGGREGGYPRCSHPRCRAVPTHVSTYRYVSGKAGRVTGTERLLCDDHAVRFVARHRVTVTA